MDSTDRLDMSSPRPSSDGPVSPLEEQLSFLPELHGTAHRPVSVSSISNSAHTDDTINNANKQQSDDSISARIPPIRSATLHRSSYVLWLIAAYAILAIFAWAVTCVLTFRPMYVPSYTYEDGDQLSPSVSRGYGLDESWYRAARVVQAIVSVLTVPLASAVCSKAAVAFVQHRRQNLGLTMRQTLVLADRGWSDPQLWWKFVISPKRHGSVMLCLSILLLLLGSIIAPLQEIFLSVKTVKVPGMPSDNLQIKDISDQFRPNTSYPTPNSLVTVLTRNSLASTPLSDLQSQLWQNDRECENLGKSTLGNCEQGQASLSDLRTLQNPWLCQLSFNFTTGVIRQFAPRFNSSTDIQMLDPGDFPQDCKNTTNGFYAHFDSGIHSGPNGSVGYSITACMPSDQTKSPWQNTRLRQDFSEKMYVNISVRGIIENPAIYKVELNTTAGSFELPNIMNGHQAGPLLDDDPNTHCGRDCRRQGGLGKPIPKRWWNATSFPSVLNESSQLISMGNHGPLLTIALALFGDGSYLATRSLHPAAFLYRLPGQTTSEFSSTYSNECVDIIPFTPLLIINQSAVSYFPPCVVTADTNEMILVYQLSYWVSSLLPSVTSIEDLTNAFNAAAFLATKQWIGNSQGLLSTLTINVDLGKDVEKPVISLAGIIFVSTLLTAFLISCFAMGIYSYTVPHWTSQLDSFAMMRIGSAMGEEVPLLVVREIEKVGVLDSTPGWIGDAGPDESIGQLGVGASTPLQGRRGYRCYEGHHDAPARA